MVEDSTQREAPEDREMTGTVENEQTAEDEGQDAAAPESAPLDASDSLPMVRDVTRARARDLRSLFSKYIRRHWPKVYESTPVEPEPPRIVGSYARLLPMLRLVPWLLVALFGISAFWDFPNRQIDVMGQVFSLEGVLRIISVSGLIGFLTNWLAITMLFNPRQRRPLLGQGLIPAQRERVIYRLSSTISEELINAEIIKRKIEESGIIQKYREMAMSVTRGVIDDPDFRAELKVITSSYMQQVVGSEEVRTRLIEYVIQKIEDYAGKGIGGIALKTYRMLNEEDFQRRIENAVARLPESIDDFLDEMDHLLDLVPEKIEARSKDIEEAASRMIIAFVENLDLYAVIAGNMKQYDEKKLEDLLKRASNEQLNYIKYLGGVLGCIGGLVIWQPIPSLITLSVIGMLIYGIDELLFRARE